MACVLKIEDLKFSWPGASGPLLNIERLEVQSGERIFLHGPSGSGKSTLLNLIGGVLSPQEGIIQCLGSDLTAMSSAQKDQFRGDHMGFIFQIFNLLPYFSALENVKLPCEFSRQKQKNIKNSSISIEQEAQRLLQSLKLDCETLQRKKVTELSIGQQQRVAAARALIGKPELIIADEPTSALDADMRDHFLQLLFNECKKSGSALIFVSHDRELGQKFDRVISLKEINRSSDDSF